MTTTGMILKENLVPVLTLIDQVVGPTLLSMMDALGRILRLEWLLWSVLLLLLPVCRKHLTLAGLLLMSISSLHREVLFLIILHVCTLIHTHLSLLLHRSYKVLGLGLEEWFGIDAHVCLGLTVGGR